jgi:hypothetical protein
MGGYLRNVLVICLLIFAVTFLTTTQAKANPVTFVETGTDSGTLNGQPFSNAAVTITATGDTSNQESWPSGPDTLITITGTSAFLQIAGVGTFNFTEPTSFILDSTWNNLLFRVGSSSASSILSGFQNVGFLNWDMTSSIGPISGMGWLNADMEPSFSTDGGPLYLNPEFGLLTFQATVSADSPVPEPCTILLVGSSLAGLVAFRKRFKAA